MPTVFVYEFLTGGGCWSLGNDPPTGSLLREGRAMRDAIATDFAACEDVQAVHLLHDCRLPPPEIAKQRVHSIESGDQESRQLAELAATADATLLIVPEFSHLLLDRVVAVEDSDGRLISPAQGLVRLASDKGAAVDFLSSRGIATPTGINFFSEIPQLEDSLFPAVLKPRDGAGSLDVQYVDRNELSPPPLRRGFTGLCTSPTSQVVQKPVNPRHRAGGGWRLEKFQPGAAVSVAMLSGPKGILPLPPCAQHLTDDGRFQYLGGSTPLPPDLATRATRLALQVANVLPQFRGYLGIDMVLGPADNGADDVVIEINPRLTTSYLGLRAACHQNLAAAMWKWAQGEPTPLTFRGQRIEFTADGNLRTHS